MQVTGAGAPSWVSEVLPEAALLVRPEPSPYALWEFSWATRPEAVGARLPREVYLARRVRLAGWKAYWRPGIRHTSLQAEWPDEVRSIRGLIKEAPSLARDALRRIRSDIKGMTRAGVGWPDLAIWHPQRDALRFIEVKGPKEAMRQTQLVWVERAIASDAIDTGDVVIVRL